MQAGHHECDLAHYQFSKMVPNRKELQKEAGLRDVGTNSFVTQCCSMQNVAPLSAQLEGCGRVNEEVALNWQYKGKTIEKDYLFKCGH